MLIGLIIGLFAGAFIGVGLMCIFFCHKDKWGNCLIFYINIKRRD